MQSEWRAAKRRPAGGPQAGASVGGEFLQHGYFPPPLAGAAGFAEIVAGGQDATLARLCLVLECQPGELIAYDPDPADLAMPAEPD